MFHVFMCKFTEQFKRNLLLRFLLKCEAAKDVYLQDANVAADKLIGQWSELWPQPPRSSVVQSSQEKNSSIWPAKKTKHFTSSRSLQLRVKLRRNG
ncbi:hypothetical protein INR49_017277 [Caranx melampygus]|nr:hypothetical protein INR49_017277 [Caranx melampygus]